MFKTVICDLLGIEYDQADQLLEKSDGSVKLAIAMHRLGIERDEAKKRLDDTGGKLWRLLDS